MLIPTEVRQLLEAHSLGDGHRGFYTYDGHYYEGYYYVDETEDLIHFTSGGPMGGWELDLPFSAIDLTTLIPPVTQTQETDEEQL